MTATNLLIQGDSADTWMTAQDWQRKFLEPLHMISSPVSLGTDKTPMVSPSHFTQNRNFTYMAFPLYNLDQLPCLDLAPAVKLGDFKDIPFYTPPGWFYSWYSWAVGSDPYRGTPPVGILVNLNTGASRFYIFTTDNTLNTQKIHKHAGPLKTCQTCIQGHLNQKTSGTLILKYQNYHSSD